MLPFLLPALAVAILFGTCVLKATSFGEDALVALIRRGGPATGQSSPDPMPVWAAHQGTVKKGETISSLLGQWLTPQEIFILERQSKEIFALSKIREGRPYLVRTRDGVFHSFEYEIDRQERLVARAQTSGFSLVREPIAYQVETVVVCGTITSNLFAAADESGEAPELAMTLVDIFGWDVDFALDLRSGDTFKVILEKRYRDGALAGYGKVLAAELVNQGKTYQGFVFQNKDGELEYYDAKGRSLRRTFLKTPIDYGRISSGFSWNRFHPIKKEWCPHPAIDYAAPVGTPVRTVGDGTVAEAARNGASGRFLRIRHNSVYETAYGHLSRYARGIRKGAKVHQGQVIGYVGNTGMSTGPHLDFRMKRNGRYVNPRRVIAPASAPVPKEHIQAFREAIEPLMAELEAATIPVATEASGEIRESRNPQRKVRGRRGASTQEAIGGM
jgi:murein DD-endopeptidase MepM/ murein hydrolase activator NlpD